MPDFAIPTRTRGRATLTELGLGGSQLGNLYRAIGDDDARPAFVSGAAVTS